MAEQKAERTHAIGLIPGDGIGPEVVDEAMRVLVAAGAAEGFTLETTNYDLGADRYLRTGEILPATVLEELPSQEAVLMGAVGDPRVAPGVLEGGLLLELRQRLDLYINLRPSTLFEGVPSALGGVGAGDVDLTIVRENTEGLYCRRGELSADGQSATELSINTAASIRRCVEYAFALAQGQGARQPRSLTLVHKKNVLERAGGLWQRIFDEVAASYPDVPTGYQHVDACALLLVTQPRRFQVIVTDNLFGDILSDLAAGLVGGIGLVGSGNLRPGAVSIFEPVHGSAPDIAGTGKANPIGAVISAALMLRHIGEDAGAARIEAAVASVAGKVAGTDATTRQIGDALVEAVS
ncbi:MAG TPA: 3-isopropylmalate dehydrogenase [Actinomycetota bacterium]|nr:3-isopropylmalate dehydrogenase [Actinomycetota bacterium]